MDGIARRDRRRRNPRRLLELLDERPLMIPVISQGDLDRARKEGRGTQWWAQSVAGVLNEAVPTPLIDADEVTEEIKQVPYKVQAAAGGGDVRIVAGGKEWSPPEISAMILQKMKQSAEDSNRVSTASSEYHPGILKMKFIFNSPGACGQIPWVCWNSRDALSILPQRLHSHCLCDRAE